MQITFEMEKETKNTIRFAEVTESEPRIGSLYIPKTTLAEIGWNTGNTITINIEINKEA